jgi:hypothetical protein
LEGVIMWHKSSGKIIYDPPRPGLKKKKDWWVIIKVDREITRYYRWWVKNRYWVDLCQPSWNAHISIIRGEKPAKNKMHLWKKYNGMKVDFEYSHFVKQAKKPEFWLVEVRCPMLKKIRNEFGVPSNWMGHMTIGRTWDR